MSSPQPLPRTPWNDASLKKGDAEGHMGREKKETIELLAAAAAACGRSWIDVPQGKNEEKSRGLTE